MEILERERETVDDQVDVLAGNDQRRGDRNWSPAIRRRRLPDRSSAPRARASACRRFVTPSAGSNGLFVSRSATSSTAVEQAFAADVADQRLVSARSASRCEQILALAGGVLDEAVPLDDLQHRPSSGRGKRVRLVGEVVEKRRVGVCEHGCHPVGEDHRERGM